MKQPTVIIELTGEEYAALKVRAERERLLPYQEASRLLARTLRRDLRDPREAAAT